MPASRACADRFPLVPRPFSLFASGRVAVPRVGARGEAAPRRAQRPATSAARRQERGVFGDPLNEISRVFHVTPIGGFQTTHLPSHAGTLVGLTHAENTLPPPSPSSIAQLADCGNDSAPTSHWATTASSVFLGRLIHSWHESKRKKRRANPRDTRSVHHPVLPAALLLGSKTVASTLD